LEIDEFQGLWSRGSADDVPPNHAMSMENFSFTQKKELQTRNGTGISFATNRNVARAKIAAFNNKTLIVLTCDNNGSIWREDISQVLLTRSGLVDFELINIFNKVIIAPILNAPSSSNYLMIWTDPSQPLRPVGGYPPPSGMTARESNVPGNINAGLHSFLVCFKTDSGFITPPQPVPPAQYRATGGWQVTLDNIPTGAAPVVDRVILATKADDSTYYVCPLPTGNSMGDNARTSVSFDFSDLSLTQSAESLFTVAPAVAVGWDTCGLTEYKGRLLVAGGLLINGNNGPDAICASSQVTEIAGGCESFDTVDGYIYVPTQNDGNIPRCMSQLFGGVLYIFKSVGIYSTQDNGSTPDTWSVDLVDSSVGCYPKNLGSITGSQNSLGISSVLLLGDAEGLFLFNGNVMRPELSWKIKSAWSMCNNPAQIRLAVDPFLNQIYVVLPTANNNWFLVGDYSLGLDSQNIRWGFYTFPWNINDVIMANVQDWQDYLYLPRLATYQGLYKLTPAATTDSGIPIRAYCQTALLAPDMGSVSVFRYLRYRAHGTGTLISELFDESLDTSFPVANITLPNHSKRDLAIQVNFVNEKCAVKFTNDGTGTSGTNGFMKVSRLQLYGRPYMTQRPTI
jgi:hypothetical protein